MSARPRSLAHIAAVCALTVLLIRVALAGEGATLRAFRAARVVTGAGTTLVPGVIVVRGASVEALLGADGEIPRGAQVVELGDVVVVPGFVNPVSSLTAPAARGGVANESGGPPADGRRNEAAGAVKLDAVVHRRLGRSPYGVYGWLPSQQGLFAGQAAVLRPAVGDEKEAKDLVLVEKAYLLMNFELGREWRDGARNALKKAAEAVVKEREEAAKQSAGETAKPPSDDKKETPEPPRPGGTPQPAGAPAPPPAQAASGQPAAEKPAPPDPLVEVMKGGLRLVVRLRSPAAIDHFFVIYDELPVKPRPTLILPPLPPELVEKLAARKNEIDGIILEPGIASLWETTIAVNGARLLLEAGFEVALVPPRDDLEGLRQMPFKLAQLCKAGLDPAQALAAVTRVPARLLGVEGKAGVLAPGALASFAVYRGDPLAGTARLLRVVAAGAEVFVDDVESDEVYGEAVR